jgi:hypothetical protein
MPRVDCRPVRARAARGLLVLCAMFVLSAHAAGPALEISPYASIDHSPLGILYGVPALGEARVLAAGDAQAELAFAAASHFEFASTPTEDVLFDGETRRVALRLRRGLAAGYEWTLELPWISRSGGELDGFIVNWHDFFGLPQGGREASPRDRLLFTYRRDGIERVRLSEHASGAGDVRVGLGKSLSADAARPVALRAELKLPTGSSAKLTGSGAADFALWVSAASPLLGADDWIAYGGAGLARLGDGDVLPEMQRRNIPFASLGIGWRALPALAFKVQVDAHRAFFGHSELAPLGRSAAQLALGGSLRLGSESEIEFVVLEDLAVGTVPDVTLRAAVKSRF